MGVIKFTDILDTSESGGCEIIMNSTMILFSTTRDGTVPTILDDEIILVSVKFNAGIVRFHKRKELSSDLQTTSRWFKPGHTYTSPVGNNSNAAVNKHSKWNNIIELQLRTKTYHLNIQVTTMRR